MIDIKAKLAKFKIVIWLKFHSIKNYTINDDLIVDVDGDVELSGNNEQLPVQFGKVTGNFCCNGIGLTTLKGCPTKVLKNFECCSNNLTSLEHAPKEVGGLFHCSGNQLTSLKYCPTIIHDHFRCSYNNLLDLNFLPTTIIGDFDCSNNDSLINVKHINCDIQGKFIHTTKNENNKIKIFEAFYEEDDDFIVQYVIYLNPSILSKFRLKDTLDKELKNKDILFKTTKHKI